jgi:multiple sugar transport system ATP-binding protein
VAVGRAIVRNPKAFLFDEPLSNLDAKLRVEMRSQIKHLQRRLATTTIYVTHDQEEAMTLGDRIVVMKDGAVQQCAPPLEVYERPANRFVASFVGTPPMSFLDGRVVRRDGKLAFDEGRTLLPLSGRQADLLEDRVDRPMAMGIRPDAFSVDAPAGAAGVSQASEVARLGVRITLVEPLGDRKDITMTTAAGKRLVARVDARVSVFEGQELQMFIDMNRVHHFEPGEMGVNVTALRDGAMPGGN